MGRSPLEMSGPLIFISFVGNSNCFCSKGFSEVILII